MYYIIYYLKIDQTVFFIRFMKDVILFCYKNLTVVIYILYIIETFGEEKSFALSDFHYFPNDILISILNIYVIINIFYSLGPFLSSSYLSLLFFQRPRRCRPLAKSHIFLLFLLFFQGTSIGLVRTNHALLSLVDTNST